jgi:hypothetical protein
LVTDSPGSQLIPASLDPLDRVLGRPRAVLKGSLGTCPRAFARFSVM